MNNINGMSIRTLSFLNGIKKIAKKKSVYLFWYNGLEPNVFEMKYEDIKFNAWTTNIAEQIKEYTNLIISEIQKECPTAIPMFVMLDDDTIALISDYITWQRPAKKRYNKDTMETFEEEI